MSEAKFLFEKGIKELELENYQEAALNFQKSLDLAPNRISTLTNLALAFIKLNKVKECEEIVEKIISIEPLDEYANLLSGHILFKKNKLTEAVAYYKKAIEINSNNDEAYFSIGLTLQKLKKYENNQKQKH
jgi:tetratricopeptide (TPR) repeat protein